MNRTPKNVAREMEEQLNALLERPDEWRADFNFAERIIHKDSGIELWLHDGRKNLSVHRPENIKFSFWARIRLWKRIKAMRAKKIINLARGVSGDQKERQ